MSHEAIFLATCNAMVLHCKLQGRLPRVTPHVCNQSRNEKLRCKLQKKQKQHLLFAMLRDKLQRVTPPLQLVSQFFEKEPITIRNQNAAVILKYSAGQQYNKLRTSDILTATCNIFFGKNCIPICKDKLPRVTWPLDIDIICVWCFLILGAHE